MSASESDLYELTTSAKLVYKILEYNDELTKKEIIEKTRLTDRTTGEALSTLKENEYIEERINPTDARQQLYTVPKEEQPASSEQQHEQTV